MSPYLAELIGTMVLILFGSGAIANVVLCKSKGNGAGWIVIATGWGLGIAVAIYAVNQFSGAHINPAVTLGLAVIGKFSWAMVPGYILAQIAGGFLGGVLVWLAYLAHWKETEDPGTKLSVFSTMPAIKNPVANLLTEAIGTFALVSGILWLSNPGNNVDKSLFPFLVGVLFWAIGLALGGPTGYAINPARDLGPRLAHFLLPIPGKGSSDWGYSWIPIVGPIIGGILGALFVKLLFPGT